MLAAGFPLHANEQIGLDEAQARASFWTMIRGQAMCNGGDMLPCCWYGNGYANEFKASKRDPKRRLGRRTSCASSQRQ